MTHARALLAVATRRTICLLGCAVAIAVAPVAAQRTVRVADPRGAVQPPPGPAQRTALPMTLDQPLVCPIGRVRNEQAVAHELSVQGFTLTTVRFDLTPLPPGAVVSGRVTWRLRPTSVPNYSAGIFNIAAQPPQNVSVPGVGTAGVQIHHIGSIPASAGYTVLRPGPWDAVSVPNAVLVSADLHPSVIAGFNALRSTLQNAGVSAPAVFQSQVGSRVQTNYAILETCHVPGPAPAATEIRTP